MRNDMTIARDTLASVTDILRARFTGRMSKARALSALKALGPSVPAGEGNAKTAAGGTYRKVGETCPTTCPQHGVCYAKNGKVGMQQARSVLDASAAWIGMARAIVMTNGRTIRLHVSGDFGVDWMDAHNVVHGYVEIARTMQSLREGAVAWTYTHLPRTFQGELYVERMAAVGIHVRWSDSTGHNSVSVSPVSVKRIRDAAKYAQRIAQARTVAREMHGQAGKICPAMYFHHSTGRKTLSCAECTLCWTRPDIHIVFPKH